MKTKIISLLMALAMIVGLFCGCGDRVETSSEIIEGGETVQTDTDTDAAGDTDADADDKTEKTQSGDKQSGTKDNASKTTSSKPKQKKISNPLKVDLKGATITAYATSDIFHPDASASKTEKARDSALRSIEEKMNCKLVCKVATADNIRSYVTTSAAAGTALCNIVLDYTYNTGKYISAKLVTDLYSVPTMDLSQDYMNFGDALKVSTVGGGTWTMITPIETTYSTGVFFNKRILKEMGYSENYVYDLEKKGNWTLETMFRLAKEGTKEMDGKTGLSENDQWGLTVIDLATLAGVNTVESFGASFLTKDAKNMLKYNMEDATVTKALNYFQDSFNANTGVTIWSGHKTDADQTNLFAAGKVLLFYAPVGYCAQFSSMSDDFGLVPVPKANKSSEYRSAINWNASMYMIPAGQKAEQLATTGSFLQAYAYCMNKVRQTSIKEYANRYFVDDQSADYFDITMKTQKFNVQQMFAHADETILCGTYRVLWSNKANMVKQRQEYKTGTIKKLDEINAKLK